MSKNVLASLQLKKWGWVAGKTGWSQKSDKNFKISLQKSHNFLENIKVEIYNGTCVATQQLLPFCVIKSNCSDIAKVLLKL